MSRPTTLLGETPSLQDPSLWRKLWEAWRISRPYVLVGLIVGMGLVMGAKAISRGGNEESLPATLLEHLGMGFIVAAIAVLFYEWGAHIKDAVEILKRLDQVTHPVVEQALVATISRAIQGQDNKPIVDDLVKYVLYLKDLDEHGDWASEGYVRYLGALLHNATHNADPLCKLSTQLNSNDGAAGEYRVDVLSPAELTDIMLAEQMLRLPPFGKYSVASNVSTWRSGQLSNLEKASKHAVEVGSVLIRRIFVVADHAAHRYPATADEMEKVLTHHIEAGIKWKSETGGYQVKLLDGEAMRDLRPRFPDAAAFIFEHHFGVFERPDRNHCVRVEVTSPSLADLRIAGLALDSKELRYFDAVWGALPLLTEDSLQTAVARWKRKHPAQHQ